MHRSSLDDEHDIQSQSRDCEPPPPPNSSGSYTNLFDTSQDVPLGGSATSLRNQQPSPAQLRVPPKNLYPNRPSPGRQRAIESRAPMATPDQFSPTTPSPNGLNAAPAPKAPPRSPRTERRLASDQKYPTMQALITDKAGKHQVTSNTAVGAKRSASAGSLSGVATGKPPPPKGVRTSPTYPPSTQPSTQPMYPSSQAAGLPPRGAPHHHQQPRPHRYKESGYSSSSTAAGAPPTGRHFSELATDINQYRQEAQPVPVGGNFDNVPGAVRRPISFVRALEMSDAIAHQEREKERLRQQLERKKRQAEEDKQLYGSTYEISV